MSELKYCQGPLCHTHDTKDRKKGPKDNRRNETRRRSSFYYLGGNACDMRCQSEWFDAYGTQALDHFGRITEAKVLTRDNAWRKSYDWNRDNQHNHYVYNHLTDERRPITEQQYDNDNIITNDGQLNI
jgi:hypothetical protein